MLTHCVAELHDYVGEGGRKMGIPVSEFVEDCYTKLNAGQESIQVGIAFPLANEEFTQSLALRNQGLEKVSKIVLSHFEL